MMKRTFIFIWFLGFTMVLHAQIQLPHFFADHMVLQREMPIPIWGTAPALSKVTVKFNKQKISTTTDANGIWMVKMKAEKAGGPYTLKVTGFNKIIIKDVLVGDVWLCTGQSNMEWTVGQSDGYEQERIAATQSNIRHFKIEHHTDFAPLDDILDTQWQVCSPETVGKFSGVGYFFAQKICGEQNVPIGLINASWGGTNIETWISREAFIQSEEFHDMIVKMPNLNTTELEALKIKHIEEIQNLALQDFSASNFINPTFDDTNCPSIEQPKIWEEQIIGNMDGIVWIRKTFELTADEAQQKAILKLSKIDDFDTTYINGVEVGQTQQWDIFRNYTLKPGVLKEGKNVIVIKITDNTGGGGIYGAEKDVALALESKTLSLSGFWKFQVEKVIFSTQENAYPSIAYNAMIHPLKSLAIKGVLWYQGESNASRAYQYRTAFPLLIEDWRKHFNQVNLPFYYVNLATYKTDGNSNIGDGWCELREAQAMTLSVPHTGMVVTTDIGNPNDIHPTNKKEVGKRLANIALHELYGKNVIYNGPSFERMEIKGNQVLVTFKDVADGLKTKGNSQVLGFEIAGADQVFYPAQAQIVNQIVVVYSDQVAQPLAVRFGWLGDDEACNLFNSADLPAVPFRTDDWKTLTKGIKYKL
jgi:sialate O-acetylesterase